VPWDWQVLCGVVELPRQRARKAPHDKQGTNTASAHVSWATDTEGPVTGATAATKCLGRTSGKYLPSTGNDDETDCRLCAGG
jgi:hypothetical protein